MNHNTTGEMLYEKYQDKLLLLANCTTDNWEDLDELYKQVWEAVAEGLIRPY